ncbi:hypothetical protein MUN82_14400 [Hymenobacter aerilatus]|uniref:Uncharacterized protein n=1 Tax=Hymenobacter aerilatus TaxID=2932251 RepID=A0A8T9SS05_9BACT|nr:hypothetical protein [Hymenobacter aerilatus]UOR04131.1 hypothetical protein MUN82_14400 [Hymenobacter aerilatus]
MLASEIHFRAALHEERFALAAVLLSQAVESRASKPFSLVQVMHLQRACQLLLAHREGHTADSLLQAAEDYMYHLSPIPQRTPELVQH